MDRMKELVNLLNNASKAYYQHDNEIMSDFEYDKLYDELIKMEKQTGIVLSDSPTQKVGFEVLSNLTKVKHEEKMLSLDKTKDIQELKSFLGENIGLLSFKMDGLTIVLNYNKGELIRAVTRGNGEVGEDVTHNAKVFKNIPIKINFKGELVLRGEAVISFDDFERINNSIEYKDKYKNTRNLCSGSVRQLNSEIAAKRNIYFFAFSVVKAENIDFNDLKSNQMKWLNKIGLQTVEYRIVNSDNVENTVYEFENKIAANKFASDGLVLTFNSINYSKSLGVTTKFPKDSIAFKWKDELAQTTLKEIVWNTSRTGLINPIAVFEPVELEGTTVNRASLHNVSIVENLKLGIGDKINVYKANMVIPQIAENITKSGNFEIPNKCPVCGTDTEILKLKDGKALKCPNPNCKAQIVSSLTHYTSRDAMNIEGFSEATFEKFVEEKIIENYTDLYRIENYKDKIINMKGFGEKSYNNIISAIDKSKNCNIANFIFALGISNVGLSNAKLLCKFYKNNIEDIKKSKYDDLVQIEGFGDVISKSIVKYFNDIKNINLIDNVLNYINFIDKDIIEDNNKILSGNTFAITGKMNIFKNRKEIQSEIEKLGGKVTSSVSNNTNYLINNDNLSYSIKNKKAIELNIPIITEEQFINMIK